MSRASVWSFAPLAALAVACGGKTGTSRAPAPPPAASAAEAPRTSPPPSGLPPYAAMPPPGVAGSKKAKLRADASLEACSGASGAHAKDPAALVKKLGEGCAAASKMKPASAIFRGEQVDRESHQENKIRVEANRCYRVYVASDDSANDVVAVLRDSAGDIAAEAPAPALPSRGALCFQSGDDATLLVSVGSGRGAWAAQVWSD